ncbi:phytase [Rhodocytophaga aerolata]|uniref:Phytase n=1 Tax=Rhodocytophaga aerolata TaxID=455078 RepID=A0ABT8RIY2_9BACT|nr:phytase [Rhodocytophaga aerolata]MDO1450775.1 phytase [Rhodocytophaga aerolata]
MKQSILIVAACALFACCNPQQKQANQQAATISGNPTDTIRPVLITEAAEHDTDDPAIWIHPTDPAQSLIIGTDKDSLGALYVYDLNGKIIEDKVVKGLLRPNNVDIEYGFEMSGQQVDIAVVTERLTNKIRIFSLPDMKPLDKGGIPVFEGEAQRAPMGISLYKNPQDTKMYAMVGRKEGPTNGSYLWQYLLEEGPKGTIKATVVRKFGTWSGKKEIESIAVDDALGYVYYSDEGVGVRKYYAHPDSSHTQLALFASSGFAQDHEGISIYQTDEQTGYIIVSDQQASRFHIFTREGSPANPHEHTLVKTVTLAVIESDGSEVTSQSLNKQFKGGLFVAMSDDKTFHYYAWKDISGGNLKIKEEEALKESFD